MIEGARQGDPRLLETLSEKPAGENEVKAAVTKWFVDEIFSILSWPDVNYQFETGKKGGFLIPGLEISLDDLLKGIGSCEEEWNRIYDVIPSLDCLVNLIEEPNTAKEIKLSREEWKIILKLKAPVTIEDLKGELNYSLLGLCQHLVTLEERGLVDFFKSVDSEPKVFNAVNNDRQGKYIKKDEEAALPMEWSSYYQQLDDRSQRSNWEFVNIVN